MLSKSFIRATAVALLFFAASCSRWLPWRDEPVGNEVNLAFSLQNNLLYLPSLMVDNREGRFVLASAAPRTVLDPDFAANVRTHSLNISEKQSLRFTPVLVDLGGVADGMIGADVWANHAVSIDYRSGLVTYQKAGIYPAYMTLFRFQGEPSITVNVDGRNIAAIVDTASPDTLVLPAASEGRGTARVAIAGTHFGSIDVRRATIDRARIGNRLLSRFLVTIDYGKRQVGIWRDPRIPL